MPLAIDLFRDDYLLSHWSEELVAYREGGQDDVVRRTLTDWSNRDSSRTEIQLEGTFVETIVCGLWGYKATGTGSVEYTALPKFPVPGAGAQGGTGEADLAMGRFTAGGKDAPQVLCEFKDIRSGLDAPQRRKGNTRSPVEQCLDYLRRSDDATDYTAVIRPTWGIVTDMSEFRLYRRWGGRGRCQRFRIDDVDLLRPGDRGVTRRFLFVRLFSPTSLLTSTGRSELTRLADDQPSEEKKLEKTFYKEYQAYRSHLYETILAQNPGFAGTRGDLVRLTQRLLDRCIFLLFCEDMGRTIGFPPNLLQSTLAEQSRLSTYHEDSQTIWQLIKELFQAMGKGGVFPPDHAISRFNGGLFADSPQLDSLRIPNHVFCARGQAETSSALARFPRTLLYLASQYNFGTIDAGSSRTITLTALGRIFEQSITDLEYMHAEAENRLTIAKVANRKRNGVYYTPEWVTAAIVEEVVGGRLADERSRLELTFGQDVPKSKPKQNELLKKIDTYRKFLDGIKVLDPACGSGAFLIQALEYLRAHHRDVAAERARVSGYTQVFDEDAVVRGILTDNLYGIDISPESVEITQLSLWLNTATKDKPLTTLDANIRCGNTLVGPEFYGFYHDNRGTLFEDEDANRQEITNVFDEKKAFPKIMGDDVPLAERGFDCVIGNPPYVKLQNVRQVRPDETEFLVEARRKDGTPRYLSTQTGNFDIYLPFIERGLEFLRVDGRMGYIAPNVWLKSEYGEGLKKLAKERGHLRRWIDFGSFQVFDEATTYTALQYFDKRADRSFAFHLAADGNLDGLTDRSATLFDMAEADPTESWDLVDAAVRPAFDAMRLRPDGTLRRTLGDRSVTTHVFQGLITSADWIYHLDRIGPNRYRQIGTADQRVHPIEDAIMRPLVSGEDAKRYRQPRTTKHILFPYEEGTSSLFPADRMAAEFPGAWDYLRNYEAELRARERSAFDDDSWYRFGRNQNIDKQNCPKIGVAETVPNLRLFLDQSGQWCFNNVRVNGIVAAQPEELTYLLGLLNSTSVNWYFTRQAAPKDNGYFEANKQYIEPIPIPEASEADRAAVAKAGERLQQLHTERQDSIAKFATRLASDQCFDAALPLSWLWADLDDEAIAAGIGPIRTGRMRTAAIRAERERRTQKHFDPLDVRLRPGAAPTVTVDDDRISVSIDGATLITRYGLDPAEAIYRAALWRHVFRVESITPSVDGKKFVDRLLSVPTTNDSGLRNWFVQADAALSMLEATILAEETALDARIDSLYGLTAEHVALIRAGLPAASLNPLQR
jgi:hypothetical protein